ncbi:hypothetical protein M422DRAFT_248158 [Sphaerobolus stellatus SS14]|uniref:Uncharacterized protein n=1 Tax=Sphaerobolus stellatus (strain SS14) TaxID=990650 RepID=A0A0C9W4W0_SPHS4|nr:hypothetical protein M422DRAFT_248158 [Sphaerobolus stellatus SS14]
MPDSKKSQATCSSNTADLLSQFCEQRAQRKENHVEVSVVYGACFTYHPEECDQCSIYLEHLLGDIKRRPSMYVFTRDEILSGINEAWLHISEYIQQLDEARATFERELYEETANNHQLSDENEDLRAQIIKLETHIESLQPPSLGECIIAPTPTTESPTSSQALTTPVKASYSRKRARKLDKNEDFLNKVRKYDSQPDHWSLYMWTALVGWHQNPMSVPNALREDSEGYFLEQYVDVTAWLTKVIGELPCQAVMLCMKGIFGSRTNFETACYGFDPNLFCAEMHRSRWLTDASLPLCIGSQITKGIKECAAYMALCKQEKAPYKGKKPATANRQSKPSVHALTPAKTGECSHQWLDADLESYGQVREQVLPYDEAPPSGEPDAGEIAPPSGGANSTLYDESTMDIDQIVGDIYHDC